MHRRRPADEPRPHGGRLYVSVLMTQSCTHLQRVCTTRVWHQYYNDHIRYMWVLQKTFTICVWRVHSHANPRPRNRPVKIANARLRKYEF